MLLKILTLAVGLLLAQGTAAQGGFVRPIPITDLTIRHVLVGASILPPNESGWFLIGKGPTSINFGRPGISADNTLSASVLIARLENSMETIDQMRRQSTLIADRTYPSRFKLLHSKVDVDTTRKELCVVRRWQAEDHGAAKHSFANHLVLTSVDLLCRHPGDSRLVYLIHVSERDQSGRESMRIEPLATAYQSGFQFEPLPSNPEFK